MGCEERFPCNIIVTLYQNEFCQKSFDVFPFILGRVIVIELFTIQSWLNRYLGADKYGKVSCDDEAPGPENQFHVEATSDGRWAIKSAAHNRYFGGSDDNLDCFGKDIEGSRLWIVHLAMHPQVACPYFLKHAIPKSIDILYTWSENVGLCWLGSKKLNLGFLFGLVCLVFKVFSTVSVRYTADCCVCYRDI